MVTEQDLETQPAGDLVLQGEVVQVKDELEEPQESEGVALDEEVISEMKSAVEEVSKEISESEESVKDVESVKERESRLMSMISRRKPAPKATSVEALIESRRNKTSTSVSSVLDIIHERKFGK